MGSLPIIGEGAGESCGAGAGPRLAVPAEAPDDSVTGR